MKELRCKKCNKLLARYNGHVEVKCSRCKTINEYSYNYRGLDLIIFLVTMISQCVITHEEFVKHQRGLLNDEEESLQFVYENMNLVDWKKELI